MCTQASHDDIRASAESFVSSTDRLPHMPHAEAYQDGGESRIWMRNCRNCESTLAITVSE